MDSFRKLIVVLAVTSLTPLLSYGAAQTAPEDIYHEALLQETSARNLNRAIELYQRLLQQPVTNRALVASAYLRMGNCYSTLGQNDQARQAWEQVVQQYPEQSQAYQEARAHLQELALSAAQTAPVVASTPTVKIVYAIPKTRWQLVLPGIGYSSVGGVTLSYPALSYFYKTDRAIGLQGETLPSEDRPIPADPARFPFGQSVTINASAVALTHQWEKAIGNQIHPYIKLGPSLYRFHAVQNSRTTTTANGVTTTDGFESESKWSSGVASEVGVTLGWSRGFVFSIGYGLDVFYQPSLLHTVGSSIRGVHAARFALGYRW